MRLDEPSSKNAIAQHCGVASHCSRVLMCVCDSSSVCVCAQVNHAGLAVDGLSGTWWSADECSPPAVRHPLHGINEAHPCQCYVASIAAGTC